MWERVGTGGLYTKGIKVESFFAEPWLKNAYAMKMHIVAAMNLISHKANYQSPKKQMQIKNEKNYCKELTLSDCLGTLFTQLVDDQLLLILHV